MSDDEKTPNDAPAVSDTPDVHEVVDKIAEAAPVADPKHVGKTGLLAGVKKVDETILRLNK
jgi:hypothetical protein